MITWVSAFILKGLAGIDWLESWKVDPKDSHLKGKEKTLEIISFSVVQQK